MKEKHSGSFRIPLPKVSVIVHRPSKGKGSYNRKTKHNSEY